MKLTKEEKEARLLKRKAAQEIREWEAFTPEQQAEFIAWRERIMRQIENGEEIDLSF